MSWHITFSYVFGVYNLSSLTFFFFLIFFLFVFFIGLGYLLGL